MATIDNIFALQLSHLFPLVIKFMYEYSDSFRNNHLSMLPDYVFSYGIIPILIANVTQRETVRSLNDCLIPKSSSVAVRQPTFSFFKYTVYYKHPSPSISISFST